MQLFSTLTEARLPGLKLLPGNKCTVNCNGVSIISYRDGFRAYSEIFSTKIYERFWTPKEGDIVLDIGAYVGMFSYRASQLVGKSGVVVAIEPDTNNMALAKKNLRGCDNIRTVLAAISNEDGIHDLYKSPNTACHSIALKESKKTTRVATITIDTLVKRQNLPRVDIIKVDAEGAEMLVLEGAAETLKGDVRISMACYHTLPDGRAEKPILVNYLTALGFRVRTQHECLYADKI